MALNFDDALHLYQVFRQKFSEKFSIITDRIVDWYYRLPFQKRVMVYWTTIFSPIIIGIIIFIFYFVGLNTWQKKLTNAFEKVTTLDILKISYLEKQSKFRQFEETLAANNRNLNPIEILDKKAKELGIQISGFPDKIVRVDLPAQHPLSGQFQEVSLEYKLNRVSLKKMMKYVSDVTLDPSEFSVEDMTVEQILDTKLYFDVTLVVKVFLPYQKG